ncbi:hypothetical protein BDB01DRAFT_777331 [Pilobolus umbonatus]|nr:hypothetical protein BDB01DRAFT_777331 [Pilobolus umbonatus]
MEDATRVIVSKYARPIQFIPESNEPELPIKSETKSNGDEIAALYRTLVSTPCANQERETDKACTENDSVWCESCELVILKSDYKRHIQGTTHMVTSFSNTPTPDFLTLTHKNIGFQMVQSQGWKYEDGLGPKGEGRRHPIATVLKQDRLCIGHQERGRRLVTHKHEEIEKRALERMRKQLPEQKDAGKVMAKKSKMESRKRVALLHYLKE